MADDALLMNIFHLLSEKVRVEYCRIKFIK